MNRDFLSAKHDEYVKLNFEIHGFSNDRDKYRAFKDGKLLTFDDGNDIGFSILKILEKLGFSADELGTYAYKDIIKKIIYMISDGIDEKVIISNLMNTYSQLYLDVSYEADIGVQTLHSYIKQSYFNRDNSMIDKKLQEDIYGEYCILNYGVDAYLIADYVNNTFNLYKNDIKIKLLREK